MFNFFNKTLWKDKAKKRSQEIKDLKKENKRLKVSREKWKKDAFKYKQLSKELDVELKKNF